MNIKLGNNQLSIYRNAPGVLGPNVTWTILHTCVDPDMWKSGCWLYIWDSLFGVFADMFRNWKNDRAFAG